MPKLTLSQIASINKDKLTAQSLTQQGVKLVPINPDGSLDEEALIEYLESDQPDVKFFNRKKLVTPDEWESRKRTGPFFGADPVSGEPLSEKTAHEWAALPPIDTLTGPVAFADMVAYAKAMRELPSDMTSPIIRRFTPPGVKPIAAPDYLERAALEWPYDDSATSTAAIVRTASKQAGAPGQTPKPVAATAKARLDNLLLSLFAADELARFLRWQGIDVSRLPSGNVSPAAFASAAADLLARDGKLTVEFFDALRSERPRRAADIDAVAAGYIK